jgi:hypothetical protein
MQNSFLVICPVDPHWTLTDDEGLIRLLRSVQLIGELYRETMDFRPGERFLDLVAFLGCSPDVKLEPDEDRAHFCFIRLKTRTRSVEFHVGDHSFAPRCPQCRSAMDDWRDRIRDWQQHAGNTPLTCSSCGHSAMPWDYNWRKSAGFGRCFIEINNIYPREAIPQQQLLDTLNSHYQVNWHYFYQY